MLVIIPYGSFFVNNSICILKYLKRKIRVKNRYSKSCFVGEKVLKYF